MKAEITKLQIDDEDEDNLTSFTTILQKSRVNTHGELNHGGRRSSPTRKAKNKLKQMKRYFQKQKAKRKTKTSKIHHEMVDSNVNTIVASDHIKIVWSGVPDEDGVYEIYRNGKKLNDIKGNIYVDRNIEEIEIYQYNVIGRKKLPKKEVEK